jgi:hypothetical protein
MTGYILSIILVVLSFLLKLFIDRKTNIPIFINSLLELPVDLNFLGLSFVIAFIIRDTKNAADGLIYFITYLAISVLTVYVWRRSCYCFGQNSTGWTIFLGIINFIVSVLLMLYALNLLTK